MHQHALFHGDVSLALCHQHTRRFTRAVRVGDLGNRLGQLGLERLEIHLGDDVTRLHEVAFVDEDLLHTSGHLRSDVDFGGFDAAVAACECAFIGDRPDELPGGRCRGGDERGDDPCRLTGCIGFHGISRSAYLCEQAFVSVRPMTSIRRLAESAR